MIKEIAGNIDNCNSGVICKYICCGSNIETIAVYDFAHNIYYVMQWEWRDTIRKNYNDVKQRFLKLKQTCIKFGYNSVFIEKNICEEHWDNEILPALRKFLMMIR